MTKTCNLNNEFVERVKEIVEELGYALQVDYDSIHDVNESIDKRAYIMSITDLNEAYSEDGQNKVMPYSVITFSKSSSEEYREVAIVLFDVAKMDCGSVKLIDASSFSLNNDYGIPFIQDLVYHDAFPGEDRLRFPVDEDSIDYMEDKWDDYVQKVPYKVMESNGYSWYPSDYLPQKDGFERKVLGESRIKTAFGESFLTNALVPSSLLKNTPHKNDFYEGKIISKEDLKSSKSKVDYTLYADDIKSGKYEGEYYMISNKEAVVVSLSGELSPTVIDAKEATICIPLSEMAVIELEDDFDAEYLVTELQKDYVADQIINKMRLVTNDMGYILGLIKVDVPLALNGKSSVERQQEEVKKNHRTYIKHLEDELEKEEAKYLKGYKEVCEYCNEKILRDMLIKLEKNEISNDYEIFNKVRKILEWIKKNLPSCLEKHKDLSLNNFSTLLHEQSSAPEYIKRSFHTCVRLGNIGSHYNKNQLDNAPYLAKSVIYNLLNILNWCKELEKGNDTVIFKSM